MASRTTGRPTRARDRLRNNFITALADDFQEHGKDAIVAMRSTDPSGYIRAIASLMPKELGITHKVDPLDQLTDEQLRAIAGASDEALARLLAAGLDGQAETESGEGEPSVVH